MDSKVVWKIRRMSINQLRVLMELVRSKNGVVEAGDVSKKLGLEGKAMGGVFSSLSRQRIGDKSLVMPYGRSEDGRGLRWKLNEDLVDRDKLKSLLGDLLEGWK